MVNSFEGKISFRPSFPTQPLERKGRTVYNIYALRLWAVVCLCGKRRCLSGVGAASLFFVLQTVDRLTNPFRMIDLPFAAVIVQNFHRPVRNAGRQAVRFLFVSRSPHLLFFDQVVHLLTFGRKYMIKYMQPKVKTKSKNMSKYLEKSGAGVYSLRFLLCAGNPLLGVPRCPKLRLGHGHWKLGLPSPRLEVLQDAGWTLPAPYVVSFANRGRHPAAANRER